MTDLSELRMNVAALKRVDPYVKDILETATHVALYLFISDANEWEKTEIEGALFIYSRIGEPYNSFLIMNRLSTNNQVEPVTASLEVQCQEPFLLYRNSKGIIYGIWFYDKNECIKVANTLTRLAKESDTPSKSPPKSKKQIVQKKSNNVDIFSMLSKAQEDFNSNKSTNTDKSTRVMESKSPMNNAVGEVTGNLSSMTMALDVTSKSVMDFFAKAKVSNTSHYKSTDHSQTPACNVVNEGKPLLQRLMSHPAAHTVEHIEKQQRSITPQPAAPQSGPVPINNQSSENSILAKLQKCKVPVKNATATGHVYSQEYAGMNSSTCSAVNRSEISSITNPDESNTSGFLRIQSPTANSNNINQHKHVTNYTNAFDKFFSAGSPINAPDNVYQHNSTACDDLTAPLTSNSTIVKESAPALIPPGMFAAPSPAAENLNRPVEPLTRNQLLQAFNYLLRTDPEFVNKLHEAYVKSFSEILS